MPTPSPRIAATAGFALLAALGNYLSFPLFFGVDFLFGSVAALLALRLLGFLPGVAVAFAGSLYTVALWGHPYAVVILTAEVAFVGGLLKARRGDLVVYDAAYWLLLGVPLALAFYGPVMGMEATAVGLIAIKQPLNGLLNATLAALLAHLLMARARRWLPGMDPPRRRASEILAHVLLAFVLLPSLGLVFSYGHVHVAETERSIEQALAHDLQVVRDGTLVPAPTASDPALAARRFREHFGDRAVALLDAEGRILGERPAGWLSRHPVVKEPAPGLTQRLEPSDGGPAMLRWRRSFYAVQAPLEGTAASAAATLMLGTPAAPHVDKLRDDYATGLLVVLAISLAGLAAATAVGQRIPVQIARLARVTRAIPRQVREGESVPWPQSSVLEVRELIANFKQMHASLDEYVSALAESERRFRAITDHLPGLVMQRVRAPDGRISFTYVSPKVQSFFGVDPAEAQCSPETLLELILPEDRPAYYAALDRSAHAFTPLEAEFRARQPDGTVRWLRALGDARALADGSVVWDSMVLDETERQEAERRIRYLASYDALTGIANRARFGADLAECVEQAQRSGVSAAVLYLDLDNLKEVNDTLGHHIGDEVLKRVGKRLSAAMRATDRVGRMGGDEFVVIAHALPDREPAAGIARKLIDAVGAPVEIERHTLHLGVTLGIAMIPEDATTPDDALRKADLALYYAKRNTRGTYCFFRPEMDHAVRERRVLVDDLRTALEREEFVVEYQPQIALAGREVVGAEALARWLHPERGVIPPDKFIPLAEETGLIHEIGQWVITTACRQAAAWCHEGLPPQRMAINLSGAQIARGDIVAAVRQGVAAIGCASDLEFEITESVLFDAGRGAAHALFEELRRLGVGLAVDDFGTGYSSLVVLREAPVSRIKIDKSFVQRAVEHPDDAEIVRGVIALAHSLGKRVVAEGVETGDQLALLERLGCDEVQGYYFSEPLAPAAYAAYVRRREQHPCAGVKAASS